MSISSAELAGAAWRISSHSQQGGSTCVEVAPLPGAVGVRDTTRRDAGTHIISAGAFAALIAAIKRGQF